MVCALLSWELAEPYLGADEFQAGLYTIQKTPPDPEVRIPPFHNEQVIPDLLTAREDEENRRQRS